MGFELKNYDLGEVIELKERGNIIPSLFWAIPIGTWQDGDLHTLWHSFTNNDHETLCKSVGLLLLKNMRDRRGNDPNKKELDLSPITATLKELFPKKHKFFQEFDYKGILILSGNYPQPGWGVVVNLSKIDNSEFLSRIEAVIKTIKTKPIVAASKEASAAYSEYNFIGKQKPLQPEPPRQSDSLSLIENINSLLDYKNCYQNLKAFYTCHSKFESLLPPLSIQRLNEFIAMGIIKTQSNSDEYFFEFARLLKEDLFKIKKEDTLKLLPVEYKKLYAALKYFEDSTYKEFLEQQIIWFERVKNEYTIYFNEVLQKLYSINGKVEATFRKECDDFREYTSQWKIKKDEALSKYREKFNTLIELQWYGGPEFLISLQKAFTDEATVVSWDDVRMIGWKITAALQNIEVADLADKINQIFKVTIDKDNLLKNSKLDGSYFSDLLHFIVETDTEAFTDKREITKKLISELLRSSETRAIFSFHEIISENENYSVEELISKLGWKKKLQQYSVSLESFFQRTDNTQYLRSDVNGNELRICLESYTRDIIQTITYNLEQQDEDLYGIITDEYPEFRRVPTGKWKDQLSDRSFSLGAAQFIIYALGKEWKPTHESDWKEISKNLRIASQMLNDLSHFKNVLTSKEDVIIPLSVVLTQMIESVNNILVEMPWHFYPQIVRGEFPSILTGKAWSHSYKGEKTVRILNWENNNDLSPSLVWNPTKRNPIMTDCKIIKNIV